METSDLVDLMKNHISPERFEKILAVSAQRTKYVTLVLEDVYYTQNLSAVVRSSEALGLQDLYVIGYKGSTTINTHVAIGASGWLDVHRFTKEPKKQSLEYLKTLGYRLIATKPGPEHESISKLDLSKGPVAFIMGSEGTGISEEAEACADEFVNIPMYGFCESFNVSVSSALILYETLNRLRASSINWQLSDDELHALRLDWIKKSMNRSNEVQKEYETRLAHPNDQ
jgi:tRNA (guanosine-2'-O-)-methyltransferase